MSIQLTDTTSRFRPLPAFPAEWLSLAHAFVHQARNKPHALAVVDSTGTKLTYRQLLIASIALANALNSLLNDSTSVGIMLPPSAGAVIANIAVAFLGKISVNLNYTFGQKAFDSTVADCELKHIISSSRFLKRIELDPKVEVINLEDIKEDVTALDKIRAWCGAELIPEQLLGLFLPGLKPYRRIHFPARKGVLFRNSSTPRSRLNDPATIIFTAGSTGTPKGVVLSHSNILSNIHAIHVQGHVQPGETLLGVIPFFHSFGLTMTFWTPLCLGETVVYHYDPRDARRIGQLCENYKATALITTPTLMGIYLKRGHKEQFASIRKCILGGEKAKKQQLLDIEDKLGIEPVEGYGLAETSPVVSCNVPGQVTLPDGRVVWGTRSGTVGLPLPGTTVEIRDEISGAPLPPLQEGMIFIKGPQVMMGYLNKPAQTHKVLKDGWFSTGDIGHIDPDGFLTITGRLSQFSKIAGEMVPHLGVEEEIMRCAGVNDQSLCVTSAADPKWGEKLVVVYSNLGERTPDTIVRMLKTQNISNLWIPEAKDFIHIDDMPILPNGKLHLKAIKQLVQDRYCSTSV